MDPRVTKLANVLVHYSLGLKKGQLFKIKGEPETLPLIEAVYQEAIDVGAHPTVSIQLPQADEYLLKHGSNAQLTYISPVDEVEFKKMDAYLGIWGTANTRNLTNVSPDRVARTRTARQKLMEVFFKRAAEGKLRWCGTQFPTNADAQDADMSLTDYEDFVYKAGNLHRKDPVALWEKMEKEQDRLIKVLDKVGQLHIKSANADLKLNVKGRKWINCCGHENFPDGEVFTSPIENSAEGYIRFTFPAVYLGREVQDVRLEFKKGKIVKATAAKNEDYLIKMLDMDKGGRFLGEVAIGTNYEIKQFSRNTLFDEKIGGTCHVAAGNSYPETGGKNKSGLHWDMVCDLKKDSEILADGKVVYRNGKFVI